VLSERPNGPAPSFLLSKASECGAFPSLIGSSAISESRFASAVSSAAWQWQWQSPWQWQWQWQCERGWLWLCHATPADRLAALWHAADDEGSLSEPGIGAWDAMAVALGTGSGSGCGTGSGSGCGTRTGSGSSHAAVAVVARLAPFIRGRGSRNAQMAAIAALIAIAKKVHFFSHTHTPFHPKKSIHEIHRFKHIIRHKKIAVFFNLLCLSSPLFAMLFTFFALFFAIFSRFSPYFPLFFPGIFSAFLFRVRLVPKKPCVF
jgi:hypothetical protein